MFVDRSEFLEGWRTECLNPLSCGILQLGCWLHQSVYAEKEVESASRMEVTLFCKQITELAAHHICCILSVESTSQVLPTLEGNGLHKGVDTR